MTPTLSIKIEAIQKNWSLLNQYSPLAECGAVIKADAYGLGAIRVLQALLAEGCRIFFVATLDEAVELRETVPGDYRLVVLGGQAATSICECLHYNLTPTLVTTQQVNAWLKANTSVMQPVLKIDSGMHRLGLSPKEFARFEAQQGDWLERLNPAMVMSHLACANEPTHGLNKSQLSAFTDVFSAIKKKCPGALASLANSSGIFLGESYHFDLIRPGIALYGGNPLANKKNPMKPVVKLCLPVMQIKHLKAGDTVGYGADFSVQRNTRIATVIGGYADGLFRYLSAKGHGYCHGLKVPLAGRVSMDSSSFDITAVKARDEDISSIEILCDQQSIDDLAASAGTISYEILTAFGSRYRREYIG